MLLLAVVAIGVVVHFALVAVGVPVSIGVLVLLLQGLLSLLLAPLCS